MTDTKKDRQDLLDELSQLQRENEKLKNDLLNSTAIGKPDEYLLLLDNIDTHVFYLLDPATYGIVNKAHADFFGVTKTDLEHKSLYEILSKDEAETCVYVNQQIFVDKKQVVTEEVLKGADGKERIFSFTKTPKLDEDGETLYVVCTGQDITDRVQTQEALKASEFFLENVIESIQDGVCVLDRDLNIIHTNKVMQSWYQGSKSLLGQKCFNAFHNSDTPCQTCPTTRALTTGLTESDIVPGKPGTSPDWLEVFSYPIKNPESNEITGVVEFVRDISEKIRLEKQLSQAQKMEAVGTLSGGIAHDFNNILQAMLGSIQLLLSQKNPNHPDRRYLTVLENSVDRAQELTSRLLYFSRNIESNLQSIDLNRELPNMVTLLERSIPKMVSIKQVYGKELKPIRADIVQIEQVILNLSINASYAMPDGGELFFQTDNIYIDEIYVKSNQGFQVGDYVMLTVSDTGCGMDKDTVYHIFEPFFTTKPTSEGTGLGLSMVYGIIKNHGGMITCSSTIGTGTTFKIYFPAIVSQQQEQVKEATEEPLHGGTETILIVDDEPMLLDIACETLGHFGYKTLTASSGEEALNLLQSQKDRVDLVILDLNMPGMGGYKCMSKITESVASQKIIIASGFAVNGNTQSIIDTGARAFLTKPFKIKQLLSTVRQVLDQD